jgi:Flp pilus assembly secretin CpaC
MNRLLTLLAIFLCTALPGFAQTPAAPAAANQKTLSGFVGQNIVIPEESPDSVTIDRRDLLTYLETVPPDETRPILTALHPGSAHVKVQKNGTVIDYLVILTDPNEDDRARTIREMVNDPGLGVRFVGGAIVLEGAVQDDISLRRALSVANAYSPSVINFMTIQNPMQVRIKVNVLLVETSENSNIGVQYGPLNSQGTGLAVPFGLTEMGSGGAPFFKVLGLASRTAGGVPVPGMSNLNSTGADINGTVNLAANDGKIKVLQDPTLTVMNGQSAVFRVGGEFPITTRTFDDTGGVSVSVTYRPFGISLLVTPLVEEVGGLNPGTYQGMTPSPANETYGMRESPNIPLTTATSIERDGSVKLFVRPEISELDYSRVDQDPVETRVALKHEESLVIGGLFDDEMTENLRKVPFIEKVPVLGELFKNRTKNGRRRELVFVLTPHIVNREELADHKNVEKPRMPEMASAMQEFNVRPEDPKPVKISASEVGIRPVEAAPAPDRSVAPRPAPAAPASKPAAPANTPQTPVEGPRPAP